MFHDGKRLPQSSCARPNWLKPAMASIVDRLGVIAPRPRRQAEPQIAAADRDRLCAGGSVGRSDLAVAPAVGGVDHVVQAQRKSVDPKLRVPLAEAGQHDALLLGAAIAVAIAQEPDVGRGRHQHAAEAGQHAVRERQPVGEDGRMLITAVAVAVLQPPDPSRGRSRPDSRSSRRHRAARPRPRRSPPGSPPPARRRPARSSAQGRPARTPPAPRAADARPACRRPGRVAMPKTSSKNRQTSNQRVTMIASKHASWIRGDHDRAAPSRRVPEQQERQQADQRHQAGQERDLGIGMGPVDPAADRVLRRARGQSR